MTNLLSTWQEFRAQDDKMDFVRTRYGELLLLAMRVLWIILVVLAVVISFIALAWRYNYLIDYNPAGMNPFSYILTFVSSQELTDAVEQLEVPIRLVTLFFVGADALSAVAYMAVGLVMFWFRPSRLTFFVSLSFIFLGLVNDTMGVLARTHPDLGGLASLLQDLGLPLFLGLLYFFPDGVFIPRFAKWAFGVFVLLVIVQSLVIADDLDAILLRLEVGALLITGIGAQVYRYRHVSSEVQRKQTKWFLYGLVIYFGLLLVGAIYVVLVADALTNPGAKLLNAAVLVILSTVGDLTLALSMGASVLRLGLYEVDLVIKRSMLYGLLVAALAPLFAGLNWVIETAFLAATGNSNEISVLITTVLVGFGAGPLRETLEEWIDRHFKKPPDPAQDLEKFAKALHERLYPLDARRMVERFGELATKAYESRGGELTILNAPESSEIFQYGNWDGEPVARVTLEYKERKLGELALGAREKPEFDGPKALKKINEAAALVAETLWASDQTAQRQ